MTSTPKKQGILPFSTPIQSDNDSGYFGSNCKTSLTKFIHFISPIKDYPCKKKPVDLKAREKVCSSLFGGIANYSKTYLRESPSLKVDDCSTASDFTESFQDSFAEYETDEISNIPFPKFMLHDLNCDAISSKTKSCNSPQYKKSNTSFKKEITLNFTNFQKDLFNSENTSRKVILNKHKKVDFLEELERINCLLNIKFILSLLPAEDLTKMCCVSRKWKEIVLSDKDANSRRQKYLEELIEQKENKRKENLLSDDSSRVRIVPEFKILFSDIANLKKFDKSVPNKQPLVKQISEKFKSFVEEGKNLKNGTLKKCPRCGYAAESCGGEEYFCKHCNYSFCQSCWGPFSSENHSCKKPEVSAVIGSKKSKKNLRRL
ncbi:uncharacterized protein TNIN_385641 [Trichonephila inaurata madagascariensis]|uniref:F-box domain-containing protein n=1 Tax=Trichonephila inaurata madagascariensis TaxID=2747483 RepID=A0A8X6YA16_9ARAC|nr:uncharacterized protein TNIN_385641 [Trichonephila inaurata madagascariensis]